MLVGVGVDAWTHTKLAPDLQDGDGMYACGLLGAIGVPHASHAVTWFEACSTSS